MKTTQIHTIQTGKVKVKQFQATGNAGLFSRLWQLLFTKKWSEWLPIYCWLIEHPNGLFLIDTGETAKVHKSGHLPDSIGFRSSVQYDIKPEDEIDAQLKKLGVSIDQISAVFLTHFHSDHMDGLIHFPDTNIFASKQAWEEITSPKGERAGFLKHNLPDKFCPLTFAFDDTDPDFGPCKKMTPDGSIAAIPLPGHCPGHTGYVIRNGHQIFVCSGDMTFNADTLEKEIPFVIFNTKAAITSIKQLKNQIRSCNAVMLASHDPKAPKMMNTKTGVK